MSFPFVGAILSGVSTIIDRVIPDKNLAEKTKLEIQLAEARGDFDLTKEQLKVNAEQAKHENIFISGPRPAIMWICAFAFGYYYICIPIIATIAVFNGFDVKLLPTFDYDQLFYIMGTLLGLGSFRTYEKLKHVNKNR